MRRYRLVGWIPPATFPAVPRLIPHNAPCCLTCARCGRRCYNAAFSRCPCNPCLIRDLMPWRFVMGVFRMCPTRCPPYAAYTFTLTPRLATPPVVRSLVPVDYGCCLPAFATVLMWIYCRLNLALTQPLYNALALTLTSSPAPRPCLGDGFRLCGGFNNLVQPCPTVPLPTLAVVLNAFALIAWTSNAAAPLTANSTGCTLPDVLPYPVFKFCRLALALPAPQRPCCARPDVAGSRARLVGCSFGSCLLLM